jgi:hypothetical protein
MSDIVIPEGQATDLAVLEKLTPSEVFAEGGTEPIYQAIKKEVSGIVADVSNKEGREAVAALAYKVARSKTFLDKLGAKFVADIKEKAKKIDRERGLIWDNLEALQKEVRQPLTEWETKEEARNNAHKMAIVEVENLAKFSTPPTVAEIEAAITRGLELSKRDWEEHKEFASGVLFTSSHTLGQMLIAAKKTEAERAELEELRKLKAERDAAQAENTKAEETEKARKAAEDAGAERERKRIADEKKKADAEAAAREKDKAHRSKINSAILDALMKLGLKEDKAKEVITAIVKKQVPHTTISY